MTQNPAGESLPQVFDRIVASMGGVQNLVERAEHTPEPPKGIVVEHVSGGITVTVDDGRVQSISIDPALGDALGVVVRGTLGNHFYAAQFERVRSLLREGASLSRCIEVTELRNLTPMAFTLVGVSEEGGHMDESLLEVARFSEDQLNRRVTLLSKLMEPATFIVVGGFVGLVYFGFFLAVLAATQSAR